MFQRSTVQELVRRIKEPRRFIQVLAGPRQAGKTTIARQAMDACGIPTSYASADEPATKDRFWIEQQWESARMRLRTGGHARRAVLVLDEIQKVTGWSELVKRLWDEDTASRIPLHVILLGSSPMLVQRGLSETLAGRFETLPVVHWAFDEMREAFGWDLDAYLYYGGYPGAAPLIEDGQRWRRYILDSLVETSISRDVLLMTRVDKPALLRQLYDLACAYSGQVLSFQKMAGQLQDAGNTTTLAHYLELLGGAGLVAGLQKFTGGAIRSRGSSPKLVVLNTALMTARSGMTFAEARTDLQSWGRLVESAAGAYLVNSARSAGLDVYYWRDRDREVDFVLQRGKHVVAIEVKSGTRKATVSGLDAFKERFTGARTLLVGGQGLLLEDFFRVPVSDWVA